MGGLGNQLQQYALYEKLRSLGKETKLDILWFENQEGIEAKRELELLKFHDLQFEICSQEEKEKLIGKEKSLKNKLLRRLGVESKCIFVESKMYSPEIFRFENMYLEGYWACEQYYGDIMDELRKKIIFPSAMDERNKSIAYKMQEEDSVALHIRRGDYLDAGNAEMFGNICTESYYDSAIAYMKSKFPQTRFYIFSDDMNYVRRKYTGDEFTLIDWNVGKNSFYDMYLMSMCRHSICANSTFSIWGARLNAYSNKVMIRPFKHKNTQIIDPDVMREYWKQWILMDEQGRVI